MRKGQILKFAEPLTSFHLRETDGGKKKGTTETDGKLTAVGLVGVVLAVVVAVAAPQLQCAAAVLALELVGFARRRRACAAAAAAEETMDGEATVGRVAASETDHGLTYRIGTRRSRPSSPSRRRRCSRVGCTRRSDTWPGPLCTAPAGSGVVAVSWWWWWWW